MSTLEFEIIPFKIKKIRGLLAKHGKELGEHNFKCLVIDEVSPKRKVITEVFGIEETEPFVLITRDEIYSSKHDEKALPLKDMTNKIRHYLNPRRSKRKTVVPEPA